MIDPMSLLIQEGPLPTKSGLFKRSSFWITATAIVSDRSTSTWVRMLPSSSTDPGGTVVSVIWLTMVDVPWSISTLVFAVYCGVASSR